MARIRNYNTTDVVTASTNPSALVEYPVHETNDIILLMLAVDGVNIPALPSGYTDIQNQAGSAQAYRLCYKAAASAAEACPTLSLSASEEWHIGVFAISGADYADPINFSAERTATDNAIPFTWTSSASTDEDNVLIFQFINSDTGLALTAITPGYTNIVNGDAGSAGFGAAYTFQESSGSILDCVWKGRANDDTTACAVGINDDGNGTRPGWATSSSVGTYLRNLGTNIESDTSPVALTYGAIGMKDVTEFLVYDGTSTYTDDTTDINDVGTADVTITNATGACWYFGYDYIFSNLVLQISTAAVGGTIVWEYWNGSSWATLTVAGVLTAAGWARITWTPQGSWATTHPSSGTNRYFVRYRLSAGTFTTAPILSRGHVGGWLTTYDAVAATADAGVNPYMDASHASPASTSNFSGFETQFGAALDMDTGILLIHQKGAVSRDYAVDPPVVDTVKPVTNIGVVGRSGAISAYGGNIIVLADADSEYEAYTIHGKGSLTESNNDYNTFAIGLNNGAYPYAQIGTLNKSAVTRMLVLPQGANGALLCYTSILCLISEFVIAGGDSTNPLTLTDIVSICNNSIGTKLALNGVGDFQRVYVPVQFGGNGRIVTGVSGAVFQMPTKYDGRKYFDYNGDDNILGFTFYGASANDTLSFINCVFKGSQPYRWEFDSSHSGSAVLDFSGTTVEGATVTLRSTSDLDDVKFDGCPTFTQNGATLTGCSFVDTKVSSASPADAALLVGCDFTSGGTGHGIEISGTAADMTLDGVTFSGYSGTSTDAPIYVNIATGIMTIYITGGGSIPTIRTAGATVTVTSAVTVKVTVKDVNTGTAIENARVLVEAAAGGDLSAGTDILTGLTNSSGILQTTTFAYTNSQPVTGRARRASTGYGALYKTAPISGTITSSGLDVTVFLIPD